MAKKKKVNKQSKSYLKKQERLAYKKALKEWSLKVRTRDGFKCVICNRTEFLNAHHIIEKIYYKEHSLNPDIGISLCSKHHLYNKFSAHTNCLWFSEWLRRNKPDQYKLCLSLIGEYYDRDKFIT